MSFARLSDSCLISVQFLYSAGLIFVMNNPDLFATRH